MNPRFLGQFIILLLVASQASFAAIRTVSKGTEAQYSTITAALAEAVEGDEIVITDFETYKEQVTINKNRITLRSQTPALAKKPIIVYQDKTNVGPTTHDEAQIESKITFDQNGAVRVMRAQGVIIDGIILDGGGAAPFAYPGIWGQKGDPLFHGNSALTLFVAGDVIVRNCELRNAYFGIYIKDRNEGGIFANSNPADLETWRVVPLSGFAKTGNHLFEYNRIHDNSWGTFFESTWDLGTTIRYNLYYENHHTSKLGPTVKGMPDGGNQPGGAFLFKDMILSPLAIYNNTFWHNHALFAAHWKAGPQHLIFNNIYAEPYVYWAKNPDFQNPFMDYTASFVNRMKNCLFACQMQAPDKQTQNMQWNIQDPDPDVVNKSLVYNKSYSFTSRVPITNDILVSEKAGQDYVMTLTLSKDGVNERDTTKIWHEAQAIQPGALILGATAAAPFPKAANDRWLEPKFQSTDPTDARFLTPDWDDPVMKQYIVDQGWREAGIRDADGSIADIGAISYTKRQDVVALIKPTEPITISGTTATAAFNMSILAGEIKNPVIQYVRWIDLPPFEGTEFGPAKKLILTNILTVTPSKTTVTEGLNKFTFTVPARNKTNAFGFLEIVVKGTNTTGDTVTSNVGLLPYRALAYKFVVKVFDIGLTKELKEVRAGDTVMLKVIPMDSTGKVLTAKIDTAEASLGSSYLLLSDKLEKFAFPRGFTKEQNYPVVFTKVPPNGNLENVSVAGKFMTSTTDTIGNAIRGTSDGIKILPGPADHVKFYDPPSKGIKLVFPGLSAVVTAKVYDRFDNLVDKTNLGEKTVTIKSLDVAKGDVDGEPTSTIDDTGAVTFKIKVTGGNKNETFPIVATLPIKGTSDSAIGKVGAPRDRFLILYSDTVGAKVESAKIEGVCGDRHPVTIIATNDGSILTTRTDTPFDIDFPGNTGVLNAYLNPTDTAPISQYHLTNGKAKIWITSTGNSISNGEIAVYSSTDVTIVKDSRLNIFFTAPQYEIKSGAYYADNGIGQVNRLEIYYKDTLKSVANLPDSLELYWPGKIAANKLIAKNKFSITLDPANNKHVTVKLDTPFDTSITASSGGATSLGTVYWRNPATPAAPVQVVTFNIADSVGPLLSSAIIIERIGAGDDTLNITFSESVPIADLVGTSLQVIKNNGADKIDLTIKSAADIGNNVIRIVVPDGAASSPVAGDMLKIKAPGPITDQFNNSAHPDNRPVKIKIKQIPASVLSAFYYDKNADGIVDTLTIQFNKNVSSEYFKVFAMWTDNRVKDTIRGAGISDGAAMELIVKLKGEFTKVPADITSGALSIAVANTEFPGVIPFVAVDKAPPVLVSADYFPGAALSVTQSAPDTLRVVYSEAVTAASDPEPFIFKDKSSSLYSMILESPVVQSASGIQSTYIVKSVSKFPVNGDSVNIKVGKIVDKLNNFQDNANNKRVALRVHPAPYSLSTKIGPNPFKADGVQKITLIVDPLTKMTELFRLNAKLKIYDEMGNVVMESVVTDFAGAIKFEWDGSNKGGRLVGAGTYIAKLVADAKNLDPIMGAKANRNAIKETFKIGVKR